MKPYDIVKDMTNTRSSGPVFYRRDENSGAAADLYKKAIGLLARNDTSSALPVLRQCIKTDPAHFMATRAVAAIAMKNGQDSTARAILEAYFTRFPGQTLRSYKLGTRPALLTIRGFSGTRIIPWRSDDGTVSTRFRGGHFTTRFLVENPTYPEHRYTIARDNILRDGALPPFGAMLNTIADPDLESETLRTLETYVSTAPDIVLLNHPSKVLLTTRDANYQRLRGMPGIRFPQTHRVEFDNSSADDVAATMTRLGLDDAPVILRATGTHTARSTGLISGRADLDAYVRGGLLNGPHYLIRYVKSLWRDAFFRKLRLFAIDGVLYPVVCHLDKVWNVHGGNRKDIMRHDDSLMDEEKRFLKDWRTYVGTANADRLESLVPLVGLEFFGIDFTFDEAGLLIYEMNPAMRHSFGHAKNFPYKLPYDQAITRGFSRMLETHLGA